jgi:hypothetical protein
MPRERDIRNAIAANLLATNNFDRVIVGRLPEDYGQGASALALAVIRPGNTRRLSGWDDDPTGGVEYTCTMRLMVLARNEDPRTCDEAAELLMDAAIDVIDGKKLVAGLTIPAKTATMGWAWQDTPPPERRIEAMVVTNYLVPWDQFDTTP